MKKIAIKLSTTIIFMLLLLSGCGDNEPADPATFGVPTARPTPANFEGVPNAATVGPNTRQVAPNRTAAPEPSRSAASPLAPTATPDEDDDGVAASGGRLIEDADPTALAKLFGSPGPGYQPGGGVLPLTPGIKGSGQPSRPAPTPTLNTNPGAVKIESLKTTQVSFLTAYRQAAVKAAEANRAAKLVFASANILKPERTVWSFLFLAGDGSRMWRVIYDSEGNRLDVREVAPAMLNDVKLIDISRVLDSPALLEQASAAGLNLTLPIDILNFQVEGLSKQPCFIFTNVAQGKQVALNAYTGQIVRNDFGG